MIIAVGGMLNTNTVYCNLCFFICDQYKNIIDFPILIDSNWMEKLIHIERSNYI